ESRRHDGPARHGRSGSPVRRSIPAVAVGRVRAEGAWRGENRMETTLHIRLQHLAIQGIAACKTRFHRVRASRIRCALAARTIEPNFHRRHRSTRGEGSLARAPSRCHRAARGPRRDLEIVMCAPSGGGLAMPPRTDARARNFWPVLSLAAVIALAPLPVRADLRTRAPEAPKPG